MNNRSFQLQIKETAPDGCFLGYASVFAVVDSDNEVVDKGAFKDLPASVPILWQHDRAKPVGFSKSLQEDSHGLKVEGRLLVDTEDGRRALSFLKLGLELGGKPGLSIGFLVPKNGDYFKDGVRHFSSVTLKEFSIVTFPANDLALATSAKGAGDDDALAQIGSALDDVHQHLQAAKTYHEKALGSLNQLRDQVASWYARTDVQLPNPVGNRNRAAADAALLIRAEDFLRQTKDI